jgi:hypothetical protein
MFAGLGRDNLLLDALQQLLSFGQAQTKIADRVEITGPVDLHHIDAPAPTCGIRLHQTQDPAHAFSSGRISGRIIGHFGATPNFSTVAAPAAHVTELIPLLRRAGGSRCAPRQRSGRGTALHVIIQLTA